jgi:hypothetical protein
LVFGLVILLFNFKKIGKILTNFFKPKKKKKKKKKKKTLVGGGLPLDSG